MRKRIKGRATLRFLLATLALSGVGAAASRDNERTSFSRPASYAEWAATEDRVERVDAGAAPADEAASPSGGLRLSRPGAAPAPVKSGSFAVSALGGGERGGGGGERGGGAETSGLSPSGGVSRPWTEGEFIRWQRALWDPAAAALTRGLNKNATDWEEYARAGARNWFLHGERADFSAELSEWWGKRQEGLLFGAARRGFGLLSDQLVSAAEERVGEASFIRNLELDYKSELGSRRWQAGVSALGALREGERDVLAWEMRGYAADEGGAGGNVGLIYRRLTEQNAAMFGANAFLDYERHGDYDETFWRWSFGGEYRSAWADVFANTYWAISDAVEKRLDDGRYAIYTRDGYDVELALHAPSRRWMTGALTYYHWEGKFGQANDSGLRYALDLWPFGGVHVRAQYEDPSGGAGDWGGEFRYNHYFNAPPLGLSYGAGNYSARRYLFSPVKREYAQRISAARLPDLVNVTVSISAGSALYRWDLQAERALATAAGAASAVTFEYQDKAVFVGETAATRVSIEGDWFGLRLEGATSLELSAGEPETALSLAVTGSGRALAERGEFIDEYGSIGCEALSGRSPFIAGRIGTQCPDDWHYLRLNGDAPATAVLRSSEEELTLSATGAQAAGFVVGEKRRPWGPAASAGGHPFLLPATLSIIAGDWAITTKATAQAFLVEGQVTVLTATLTLRASTLQVSVSVSRGSGYAAAGTLAARNLASGEAVSFDYTVTATIGAAANAEVGFWREADDNGFTLSLSDLATISIGGATPGTLTVHWNQQGRLSVARDGELLREVDTPELTLTLLGTAFDIISDGVGSSATLTLTDGAIAAADVNNRLRGLAWRLAAGATASLSVRGAGDAAAVYECELLANRAPETADGIGTRCGGDSAALKWPSGATEGEAELSWAGQTATLSFSAGENLSLDVNGRVWPAAGGFPLPERATVKIIAGAVEAASPLSAPARTLTATVAGQEIIAAAANFELIDPLTLDVNGRENYVDLIGDVATLRASGGRPPYTYAKVDGAAEVILAGDTIQLPAKLTEGAEARFSATDSEARAATLAVDFPVGVFVRSIPEGAAATLRTSFAGALHSVILAGDATGAALRAEADPTSESGKYAVVVGATAMERVLSAPAAVLAAGTATVSIIANFEGEDSVGGSLSVIVWSPVELAAVDRQFVSSGETRALTGLSASGGDGNYTYAIVGDIGGTASVDGAGNLRLDRGLGDGDMLTLTARVSDGAPAALPTADGFADREVVIVAQDALPLPGGGSRGGHQFLADSLRHYLYLLGGDANVDNGLRNDVWLSEDGGQSWNLRTDDAAWSARADHAAAVAPNGDLYVYGGNDGTSNENDLWVSRDRGATWAEVSATGLPSANDDVDMFIGGAGDNVTLFLIPGDGGAIYHSDDGGATWQRGAANIFDPARLGFGSAFDGETFWVHGGKTGDDLADDVWSGAESGSWDEEGDGTTNPPPALWRHRLLHSGAAGGGSLHIIGGAAAATDEAAGVGDVWRSTDGGATWEKLAPSDVAGAMSPRHSHGAAELRGALYVAGGLNGANGADSICFSQDYGEEWACKNPDAPTRNNGHPNAPVLAAATAEKIYYEGDDSLILGTMAFSNSERVFVDGNIEVNAILGAAPPDGLVAMSQNAEGDYVISLTMAFDRRREFEVAVEASNPDGDAVFRLNVKTYSAFALAAPAPLRVLRAAPGGRAIEGNDGDIVVGGATPYTYAESGIAHASPPSPADWSGAAINPANGRVVLSADVPVGARSSLTLSITDANARTLTLTYLLYAKLGFAEGVGDQITLDVDETALAAALAPGGGALALHTLSVGGGNIASPPNYAFVRVNPPDDGLELTQAPADSGRVAVGIAAGEGAKLSAARAATVVIRVGADSLDGGGARENVAGSARFRLTLALAQTLSAEALSAEIPYYAQDYAPDDEDFDLYVVSLANSFNADDNRGVQFATVGAFTVDIPGKTNLSAPELEIADDEGILRLSARPEDGEREHVVTLEAKNFFATISIATTLRQYANLAAAEVRQIISVPPDSQAGLVGEALAVTGGKEPFTFSVVSHSGFDGVTLAADGRASLRRALTADDAPVATMSVSVRDANGRALAATLTYVVEQAFGFPAAPADPFRVYKNDRTGRVYYETNAIGEGFRVVEYSPVNRFLPAMTITTFTKIIRGEEVLGFRAILRDSEPLRGESEDNTQVYTVAVEAVAVRESDNVRVTTGGPNAGRNLTVLYQFYEANAALPVALAQHNMIDHNGMLYVIGGYKRVPVGGDLGSDMHSGENVWRSADGGANWEAFDADPGDNWEAVGHVGADAAIQHRGAGVVSQGGTLYVIAGTYRKPVSGSPEAAATGGTGNDVWTSSDGADWTLVAQETAASVLASLNLTRALAKDGALHVMGGYDSVAGEPSNDVWSSSDNGATWTRHANALANKRFEFAAAVAPNGNLLAHGGNDGNANVWTDVRASSDGETWSELAIAGTRNRHGMAELFGTLYMVGGIATTGAGDSAVSALRVLYSANNGETWGSMDAPPFALQHGALAAHRGHLYYSGGNTRDHKVVVVGGATTTVAVDSVNQMWVYSPRTAKWTRTSAPSFPVDQDLQLVAGAATINFYGDSGVEAHTIRFSNSNNLLDNKGNILFSIGGVTGDAAEGCVADAFSIRGGEGVIRVKEDAALRDVEELAACEVRVASRTRSSPPGLFHVFTLAMSVYPSFNKRQGEGEEVGAVFPVGAADLQEFSISVAVGGAAPHTLTPLPEGRQIRIQGDEGVDFSPVFAPDSVGEILGSTVTLRFHSPMPPGGRATLSLRVEDANGMSEVFDYIIHARHDFLGDGARFIDVPRYSGGEMNIELTLSGGALRGDRLSGRFSVGRGGEVPIIEAALGTGAQDEDLRFEPQAGSDSRAVISLTFNLGHSGLRSGRFYRMTILYAGEQKNQFGLDETTHTAAITLVAAKRVGGELPFPVHGHEVVVVDGKFRLYGGSRSNAGADSYGSGGGSANRDVWESSDGNSWTRWNNNIPGAPGDVARRFNFATFKYDNGSEERVCIVGGQTAVENNNVNFGRNNNFTAASYDDKWHCWNDRDNLAEITDGDAPPEARWYRILNGSGDSRFMTGGEGPDEDAKLRRMSGNPGDSEGWEEVGADMPATIAAHGMVLLTGALPANDRIILVGGREQHGVTTRANGRVMYTSGDLYGDSNGITWTQLPGGSSGNTLVAQACREQNRVVAMGVSLIILPGFRSASRACTPDFGDKTIDSYRVLRVNMNRIVSGNVNAADVVSNDNNTPRLFNYAAVELGGTVWMFGGRKRQSNASSPVNRETWFSTDPAGAGAVWKRPDGVRNENPPNEQLVLEETEESARYYEGAAAEAANYPLATIRFANVLNRFVVGNIRDPALTFETDGDGDALDSSHIDAEKRDDHFVLRRIAKMPPGEHRAIATFSTGFGFTAVAFTLNLEARDGFVVPTGEDAPLQAVDVYDAAPPSVTLPGVSGGKAPFTYNLLAVNYSHPSLEGAVRVGPVDGKNSIRIDWEDDGRMPSDGGQAQFVYEALDANGATATSPAAAGARGNYFGAPPARLTAMAHAALGVEEKPGFVFAPSPHVADAIIYDLRVSNVVNSRGLRKENVRVEGISDQTEIDDPANELIKVVVAPLPNGVYSLGLSLSRTAPGGAHVGTLIVSDLRNGASPVEQSVLITVSSPGEAELPNKLRRHRAVVQNGTIIVIGGNKVANDEATDQVWASASGLNWLSIGVLPKPNSNFGAAELNGTIYVAGGFHNGTNKDYNELWRSFDGGRNWVVAPKADTNIDEILGNGGSPEMAAWSGTLWLANGGSTKERLSLYYSTDGLHFEHVSTAPANSGLGNRFPLAGGENGGDKVLLAHGGEKAGTVQSKGLYITDALNFSEFDGIVDRGATVKRHSHRIVANGANMFILSGRDKDNNIDANVFRAPISDPSNWRNTEASAAPAVIDYAAVSHKGRIVVLGGQTGSGGGSGTRAVHFSEDGNTWSRIVNFTPDGVDVGDLELATPAETPRFVWVLNSGRTGDLALVTARFSDPLHSIAPGDYLEDNVSVDIQVDANTFPGSGRTSSEGVAGGIDVKFGTGQAVIVLGSVARLESIKPGSYLITSEFSVVGGEAKEFLWRIDVIGDGLPVALRGHAMTWGEGSKDIMRVFGGADGISRCADRDANFQADCDVNDNITGFSYYSEDGGFTWQQDTGFNFGRRLFGAAAFRLNLPIFNGGGGKGFGPAEINQAYPLLRRGNSWQWNYADSDELLGRYGHQMIVAHGSTYIVGGATAAITHPEATSGTSTIRISAGNEAAEVWRSGERDWSNAQRVAAAAEFGPRAHHAAFVGSDGNLYVYGGVNPVTGDRLNVNMWRSTDRGETWTEIEQSGMPARAVDHSHPSLWEFNGVLYLSDGLVRPRDVVFPKYHSWISEADLNQRGRVPFAGLPGGGVMRSFDYGKTWERLGALSGRTNNGLHQARAFVYRGRLWVVGGAEAAARTVQNDIWTSMDGVNWSREIPDAPSRLQLTEGGARLEYQIGDAGDALALYTVTFSNLSASDNTHFRVAGRVDVDNFAEGHAAPVFGNVLPRVGIVSLAAPYNGPAGTVDLTISADNGAGEVRSNLRISFVAPPGGQLPTPRANSRVVALDGALYLIGGRGGVDDPGGSYSNGGASSDVWISTDDAFSWELLTVDAFPRRKDFGAFALNGSLYVVGGWRDGHKINHRDVWSSANGKDWTLARENLTLLLDDNNSEYQAAAVLNGDIYVIGGDNTRRINSRLDRYQTSSDGGETWTSRSVAGLRGTPQHGFVFGKSDWPTHDFGLAELGGTLYVSGGGNRVDRNGDPARDLGEIWASHDGVNWATRGAPGENGRPDTILRHAMLSFRNSLWMIGGDGQFNSVLASGDGGESFTGVSRLPGAPAVRRAAAVELNGKMFVLGGETGYNLGGSRLDNYSSGANHRLLREIWVSADGINWQSPAEVRGGDLPPAPAPIVTPTAILTWQIGDSLNLHTVDASVMINGSEQAIGNRRLNFRIAAVEDNADIGVGVDDVEVISGEGIVRFRQNPPRRVAGTLVVHVEARQGPVDDALAGLLMLTVDVAPVTEGPASGDDAQGRNAGLVNHRGYLYLMGGSGTEYDSWVSRDGGFSWDMLPRLGINDDFPEGVMGTNPTPASGVGSDGRARLVFYSNLSLPYSSADDGQTWSRAEETVFGGGGMVNVNGTLVIVGGAASSADPMPHTLAWQSTDAENWATVTASGLPTTRVYLQTGVDVLSGTIYIAGGVRVTAVQLPANITAYSDIWASADAGETWTEVEPLSDGARPTEFYGHKLLAHNGTLFMLGGSLGALEVDSDGVRTERADVWASADGGQSFQIIGEYPGGVRFGAYAAVSDGHLYFGGGQSPLDESNSNSNDGVKYSDFWVSPDGVNWSKTPPPSTVPRPVFAETSREVRYVFNDRELDLLVTLRMDVEGLEEFGDQRVHYGFVDANPSAPGTQACRLSGDSVAIVPNFCAGGENLLSIGLDGALRLTAIIAEDNNALLGNADLTQDHKLVFRIYATSRGVAAGESPPVFTLTLDLRKQAGLPTPLRDAAAYARGGTMYVMGGESGVDGDGAPVDINADPPSSYNKAIYYSTDGGVNWETATNADRRGVYPIIGDLFHRNNRRGFNVVNLQGTTYIIGGTQAGHQAFRSPTGSPGNFEVITNNDEDRLNGPGEEYFHHAAAVALNGSLFVIGGYRHDGITSGDHLLTPVAPSNDVWSSADGGVTWNLLSQGQIFSPRARLAAAQLGGTLYVHGGTKANNANSRKNSSTLLASRPFTASDGVTTFPTDDRYIWSSVDGINWNYHNVLIDGMHSHRMIAYNGELHFIGAFINNGNNQLEGGHFVWRPGDSRVRWYHFLSRNGEWKRSGRGTDEARSKDSGLPGEHQLYDYAAVVHRGRIHIIGGDDLDANTSSSPNAFDYETGGDKQTQRRIWIFDGSRWSQNPGPAVPRTPVLSHNATTVTYVHGVSPPAIATVPLAGDSHPADYEFSISNVDATGAGSNEAAVRDGFVIDEHGDIRYLASKNAPLSGFGVTLIAEARGAGGSRATYEVVIEAPDTARELSTGNAARPTRGAQAFVKGGTLFVVGGDREGATSVYDRILYSTDSGVTWRSKADSDSDDFLNDPKRHGFALAELNNTVYAIGGTEGGDEVWRFNEAEAGGVFVKHASVVFESPPGTSLQIHHAAAVAHNGSLFLLGGYAAAAGSNQVDGDTPASDKVFSSVDGLTWTEHTSANFPTRARHAAAVLGGTMYVSGGVTSNNVKNYAGIFAESDVWASVDGVSWKRVSDSSILIGGTPARFGIHSHRMFAHDDKLWILGVGEYGASGNNLIRSGVAWRSADGGKSWQRRGFLPHEGDRHGLSGFTSDNLRLVDAALAVHRGRPYLIGGDNLARVAGPQGKLVGGDESDIVTTRETQSEVWTGIIGDNGEFTGGFSKILPPAPAADANLHFVNDEGEEIAGAEISFDAERDDHGNLYRLRVGGGFHLSDLELSIPSVQSREDDAGDDALAAAPSAVAAAFVVDAGGRVRVSDGVVVSDGKTHVVAIRAVFPGTTPPKSAVFSLTVDVGGSAGMLSDGLLARPTRGAQAFAKGGTLFVVGGNAENPSGGELGFYDQMLYSADGGGTWGQKAASPIRGFLEGPNRRGFALAELKNTVYAIGGTQGGGQVWRFSETNGEFVRHASGVFESPPETPLQIHHAAAVAHDGSLFLLGGYAAAAGGDQSDVETDASNKVFSSVDGVTWTELSANFPTRARHAAAVLGGTMYVSGGTEDHNIRNYAEVDRNVGGANIFSDVWASEDGENWRRVAGSIFDGPPFHRQLSEIGIHSHRMFAHDGNLWIVGAIREQENTHGVAYRSADGGENWERRAFFPDLPHDSGASAAESIPLADAAFAIHGGRPYLIGGDRIHVELDLNINPLYAPGNASSRETRSNVWTGIIGPNGEFTGRFSTFIAPFPADDAALHFVNAAGDQIDGAEVSLDVENIGDLYRLRVGGNFRLSDLDLSISSVQIRADSDDADARAAAPSDVAAAFVVDADGRVRVRDVDVVNASRQKTIFVAVSAAFTETTPPKSAVFNLTVDVNLRPFMPVPLAHHQIVGHKGALLLIGGQNAAGEAQSAVWSSPNYGLTWRKVGDLPAARSHHGAVVHAAYGTREDLGIEPSGVNNDDDALFAAGKADTTKTIYVIAGKDSAGNPTNSIYKSDDGGATWDTVTPAGNTVFSARSAPFVFSHGEYERTSFNGLLKYQPFTMYVAGGDLSGKDADIEVGGDIWASADGATWTRTNDGTTHDLRFDAATHGTSDLLYAISSAISGGSRSYVQTIPLAGPNSAPNQLEHDDTTNPHVNLDILGAGPGDGQKMLRYTELYHSSNFPPVEFRSFVLIGGKDRAGNFIPGFTHSRGQVEQPWHSGEDVKWENRYGHAVVYWRGRMWIAGGIGEGADGGDGEYLSDIWASRRVGRPGFENLLGSFEWGFEPSITNGRFKPGEVVDQDGHLPPREPGKDPCRFEADDVCQPGDTLAPLEEAVTAPAGE